MRLRVRPEIVFTMRLTKNKRRSKQHAYRYLNYGNCLWLYDSLSSRQVWDCGAGMEATQPSWILMWYVNPVQQSQATEFQMCCFVVSARAQSASRSNSRLLQENKLDPNKKQKLVALSLSSQHTHSLHYSHLTSTTISNPTYSKQQQFQLFKKKQLHATTTRL